MASAKTHALIAGMAGIGAYVFYCRRRQQEMRFMDAVGSGFVAAFGGLAPDLIEPASTPNHREFFHSLVSGMGLACVARKAQVDQRTPEFLKLIVVLLAVGYISHLLADAFTPKDLPFMC